MSDSGVQMIDYDGPPNVGVSRAAGDGRERTSWRHKPKLKSRTQVNRCASSVGCTGCWTALVIFTLLESKICRAIVKSFLIY
jgi:hypothetical protein